MHVSTLVSDHIRASIAHRAIHHRVGPFLAGFDEHSDHPGRNYAVPDDGATPSRSDIDDLVALFERRQRLPRLEYVPAAAPEVEPALAAAGFTVEGRVPVMVSTVDTQLTPREPAGITVALATTDEELLAAATVQHSAYEQAEPAGPHDVARLRRTVGRGGLVAVARDTASGTAVGSGLIDRFGPESTSGELAAVGTVMAYRRRGIASALSAFLARTAHAQGMSVVWLEAEAEEEEIYRRTGFTDAGQKLWMSRH